MPRGRKTELSTLDLFLLALIADGVNTIYDLRARAGLSIGGTQPALARLLKQDLLRRGKNASRKQDYALTAAGRKRLDETWPALLQAGLGGRITETGAILRLVALASRFGKDKEAIALLERAHDQRLAKLTQTRAAAGKLSNDAAANYLAMSNVLTSARIGSEAKAFKQLRAAMKKH